MATYLVVPVLAVENVGPLEAIKRSAGLLRRTWGEQIAGNLGMGGVFFLFYLALLVVLVPVFILAINAQSAALIIGVIVFFFLAICIIALVQSTLQGIYSAAVYQYAATGEAGAFFDEQMVRGAFVPSKS